MSVRPGLLFPECIICAIQSDDCMWHALINVWVIIKASTYLRLNVYINSESFRILNI